MGFLHLNQDSLPQASQRSISQVILGSVKLTIDTSHHNNTAENIDDIGFEDFFRYNLKDKVMKKIASLKPFKMKIFFFSVLQKAVKRIRGQRQVGRTYLHDTCQVTPVLQNI